MPTTTKKELVERIAARTGLRRSDVRDTVQMFLDEVVNELAKGRRLEFRDFGVFDVRSRAARVGQNPRTLERVDVPARKSVRFKPGRLMNAAFEPKVTPARKGSAKSATGATVGAA